MNVIKNELKTEEWKDIGITKIGRNEWTENEINYLIEHYNGQTALQISTVLKRSIGAISTKANKLNLH
ncbi:MAG: hypothetical protein AABY22_18210, partial [Nanoarchaeota archaeon]